MGGLQDLAGSNMQPTSATDFNPFWAWFLLNPNVKSMYLHSIFQTKWNVDQPKLCHVRLKNKSKTRSDRENMRHPHLVVYSQPLWINLLVFVQCLIFWLFTPCMTPPSQILQLTRKSLELTIQHPPALGVSFFSISRFMLLATVPSKLCKLKLRTPKKFWSLNASPMHVYVCSWENRDF